MLKVKYCIERVNSFEQYISNTKNLNIKEQLVGGQNRTIKIVSQGFSNNNNAAIVQVGLNS